MTPERQPERRIRVLMVMPSYYPVVGGMEIQVEQLIPFLREHGIEVSILTRQSAGTTRVERRDGVEIRRVPVFGGPGLRSIVFTALGIADIVRHRRRIDIIHAHSIMSTATIATLTGVILRKPRIATLHGPHEPERLLLKPFGKQRLRLFGRTMSRFISISSDIRHLLLRLGVPSAKITSIPNGIDTSRFTPVVDAERAGLRADLDLPINQPIAVFVGRLQPVKNVDVLLRAMPPVEGGHLVILGDGDEHQRLVELANSLRLDGRVEFRGMVANVADFLRVADVFVLPSLSEGLSVALLEAISCGLFPIATSVGGNVDVIQHERTGLLVPPNDVESLSDALVRALRSSEWRHDSALVARQHVVTTYDLQVIASRLADLYRDILA